jgi:hypothetical protein
MSMLDGAGCLGEAPEPCPCACHAKDNRVCDDCCAVAQAVAPLERELATARGDRDRALGALGKLSEALQRMRGPVSILVRMAHVAAKEVLASFPPVPPTPSARALEQRRDIAISDARAVLAALLRREHRLGTLADVTHEEAAQIQTLRDSLARERRARREVRHG